MITTGINKDEIKQYDYILKDGYLHGVDSHNNDISFINIRDNRFTEYAVILEPNMAEVIDGELGRSVWYTKSWLTENPVTVGGFKDVDSDEDIIELVEKYIYNHRPSLYSRTCLGFKYESEYDKIVNDPNTMTGHLLIGNERYRIEKYKMCVTIKSNKKNMELTLDVNRYYQAYKRYLFFKELNNLCGKTVGFDERVELIKDTLNKYETLGN